MTHTFVCTLELAALARLAARFEALPRIEQRGYPVRLELHREGPNHSVIFRDSNPGLAIAAMKLHFVSHSIILSNCQGQCFRTTYHSLEQIDPIIERVIDAVVKHFSYVYHYA